MRLPPESERTTAQKKTIRIRKYAAMNTTAIASAFNGENLSPFPNSTI